ncbi:MAG TPA: 4-(cytidine 5'-diphospho)-2-C-methyl-D-erythritol kinase, partial [Blastocatellia bacterium]|nr:4-(cytidine 5'-diphospho)-2-C-methyl-D-erythritol kinase [Blastocatellia bacterium]
MHSLTLPSFAKINWFIEILGKRSDGYHELRTILQTLKITDELRFTLTESEIEIVCDNPNVPCDESNLIYRAATLLRDLTSATQGVRVELRKNIPMGAGLGGGSSNAAVTLIALQQLWNIQVSPLD